MLIDTHTHVNLPQFQDDADEAIQRCLDADIWMIHVGTNVADSQKAISLAHAYEKGVYASAGAHPSELAADFVALEKLAADEKVVGIGETGLDYYRITNHESRIKKQQRELFIKHIALAQKVKKPLIIHCRDTHDDLLSILRSYSLPRNTLPGVMHFFTGTKDQARKYLDIGFYISFSGVITFAKEYEEVVRYVPKDRVLVETDAPFVAPVPHRGKRNEPSFVRYVAEKMAEIKKVSFDAIAEQTTKNARELFGI